MAETVVGIAIKAKHPSIRPTAASKETIEERTMKTMKKFPLKNSITLEIMKFYKT